MVSLHELGFVMDGITVAESIFTAPIPHGVIIQAAENNPSTVRTVGELETLLKAAGIESTAEIDKTLHPSETNLLIGIKPRPMH